MPCHRYVEEIGLAAMLTTKRLASVTPGVNLWGHVTHVPLPSASKVAHSGFETQRRYHQKSKTGVSVAPQKAHVLQFYFKKDFLSYTMPDQLSLVFDWILKPGIIRSNFTEVVFLLQEKAF